MRLAAGFVKGAGIVGAGASLVDAAQAWIKALSLNNKGDKDAALFNGFAGAASFTAAGVAGYIVLTSATAGPVGLLIGLIAIGIVCTYFALMAEDTPIGIWLDRCAFGDHKRQEGPFRSLQQERDAMEFACKQLVVEVDWNDTMSSLETDEISVVIKRPGGLNDGVEYALQIEGKAGKRLAYKSVDGQIPAQRPAGHAMLKLPLMNNVPGPFYEGKTISANIENNIEKDGKKLRQREDVVEVVENKFQKALVWVRYYPDKEDGNLYYEDQLSVAD